MAGRLAIDFGTSNTVLALWDESKKEGVTVHVPAWSRPVEYQGETIWAIPSLINYTTDQTWIGQQVREMNLYDSPGTFRWLKHYIRMRSPIKVAVNGSQKTYQEAGKDFLSTVLEFAMEELGVSRDDEVAFTVPVEAFEHYEFWLSEMADKAGIRRFRLIDEPSAAALGYGISLQPNNVYLVFDFGGGTLDVSIVLVEDAKGTGSVNNCRLLGKAGEDIGGIVIDQMLFRDTLEKAGFSDRDARVGKLSRMLLQECEKAKEKLSSEQVASISVMDPDAGMLINNRLTRQEFDELLDKHGFYAKINGTIQRALNEAYNKGYSEDHIKYVLMVGGSSFIPSVQKMLRQRFGIDRVKFGRPLDSVARGAAAFVAGVDIFDHIQHDYAIRHWDSARSEYAYTVLVGRGTEYPTPKPVCRKIIRATYDGQEKMGIPIYEVGYRRREKAESLELVTDPTGALKFVSVTDEDVDKRTYFWMNEKEPTFLSCPRPALKGEEVFEVTFNIDGNKRLLITAQDLIARQTVKQNFPVVRLT